MSAYIVDNKTIFNVIRGINKVYGGGSNYQDLQTLKDKAKNNPEDLFNELSELNNFSITERYGEDHGMESNNQGFNNAYHTEHININNMQLLKSLQNFSYQSCEGKAIETKLYKLLEHVEGQLAELIVRDLPEYNNANWGS